MVYFGASSYFFNTAGFAYHAAGALVFEITDSMVSSVGGTGAVPAPPGSGFGSQRSSGGSLWSRRAPRLPRGLGAGAVGWGWSHPAWQGLEG